MSTATISRVAAAKKNQSKDNQRPKIAPPTATFSDLGVDGSLCELLKSMQIKRPSEIQRACIPPTLAGTLTLFQASFQVVLTVIVQVEILSVVPRLVLARLQHLPYLFYKSYLKIHMVYLLLY